MQQFGGKDSKRHFTVVMGGKEHGLYVSSTPSSAAKKAVTKLCAANKSKKVQFEIREITQGSKKKTYGPYSGYIEKLKEPIELKGRVIKYKPVAKLSGKTGTKKGGMRGGTLNYDDFRSQYSQAYTYLDNRKIKELEDSYPNYFDQYWKIANNKNSNIAKQRYYLKKFPVKFQRLILEKKLPGFKNSWTISGVKGTIKNKEELLKFISESSGNNELFFKALGINEQILQKTFDEINEALINKINEYDP
jgi:hypothetical protein